MAARVTLRQITQEDGQRLMRIVRRNRERRSLGVVSAFPSMKKMLGYGLILGGCAGGAAGLGALCGWIAILVDS